MSVKHVLIVSASAGGGHVRAAQALERAFAERYPDIRVTNADIMQYVTRIFRKLYINTYEAIVKHQPRLWDYLYDHSDVAPEKERFRELRQRIQRLNLGAARKALIALKPDHVICTHFLPAEMLDRARRKGSATPSTSVVVTDFDVHWMWVQRSLDAFFVSTAESAKRLVARGVPAERIQLAGIPIHPVFSRTHSTPESRKVLGFRPDRPVVLFMAGGIGVGGIDALAAQVLAQVADVQVIAVAGRNEKLRAALEQVAGRFPGRLVALGFTTEIEKYMAACDVVVSKPGGLTTSECLAMGKPMVVVNPIPGQEEHNATFIIEQGAGMLAYDDLGVLHKLDIMLGTPGKLGQMQRAATAAGKARAAFDIADAVVKGFLES